MSLPTVEIAKICHEANRQYCLAINEPNVAAAWAEAPEWMRSSTMRGVVFVQSNPASEPGDAHKAWLEMRTAEGWTYGAVKNDVNKTHPCMVAFDQLPPNQQTKDILFVSIVRALSH